MSYLRCLIIVACLGGATTVVAKDIAVVGAGAAGLMAARELSRLGHNVVVFEKNDRVGGKVWSIPTEGGAVELGAVLATPAYDQTLALADEYGIPYIKRTSPFLILDETGAKLTFEEFLLGRYSLLEIGMAVQKYVALLEEYKAFFENPGFTSGGLTWQQRFLLALPFDTFAEKKGIAPIAELARAFIVGFGYGYYEDASAAYYLKFLPFLFTVDAQGLHPAQAIVFPGGFQSIFQEIANELDVRLNAEVTHIRRGNTYCRDSRCPPGNVILTVNSSERYVFDAVVIGTPLNVVPSFLETTRMERHLFSRYETKRYVVTTISVPGVVAGESIFVYQNAFPENINHLLALASPPNPTGVFFGNAYQIVDDVLSLESVKGVLIGDLMLLFGGSFGGAFFQAEWENYFPHVSGFNFAFGHYDILDLLQGRGSTYYVGSSHTFETVELVLRQAESVVNSHF